MKIEQNGYDNPEAVETFEVEERPEAAALRRIIEAHAAGQPPTPEDVDRLQATHTAETPALDIPSTIDNLLADDHHRREAAWQQIEPLLDTDYPVKVNQWNFPTPEREWLIPNWLPTGRIGMLTGEGEKGKSLLAVQLAVSISTRGGHWEERGDKNLPKEWIGPGTRLPFPAVKAGKVIFAGWEDEAGEVRRRLNFIEAAERKADATEPLAERLANRFTYIDAARFGPVWGRPAQHATPTLTRIGKWLRQQCEKDNACLLILDPLINAYGADENANEDAAQFMADWGGWARDTKCAVLILHHPPKNDSTTNDNAYRGASAWSAEARFHWQLTGQKVEKVDKPNDVLKRRKGNYAHPEAAKEIYLKKDKSTGWIWALGSPPTTGERTDDDL